MELFSFSSLGSSHAARPPYHGRQKDNLYREDRPPETRALSGRQQTHLLGGRKRTAPPRPSSKPPPASPHPLSALMDMEGRSGEVSCSRTRGRPWPCLPVWVNLSSPRVSLLRVAVQPLIPGAAPPNAPFGPRC